MLSADFVTVDIFLDLLPRPLLSFVLLLFRVIIVRGCCRYSGIGESNALNGWTQAEASGGRNAGLHTTVELHLTAAGSR